MNDKLPRSLLPTAGMKRAIGRNAKKDADLSLLLDQLDKKRKVALEQLSRRRNEFKKEIIMRNDSQCNKFRVTFLEHTNVVYREDTSLDNNRCRRMVLRRVSSFEEPKVSSHVKLPPVTRKRYSLPASLIPRNSDGKIGHHFVKRASDITATRRTVAEDTFKNTRVQQSEEDKTTVSLAKKIPASRRKSLDCKQTQNVMPRRMTATKGATVGEHQRLPRRRKITLHNLMTFTTVMCS